MTKPPKDFFDQLNEDEAKKKEDQEKEAVLKAVNKAGIKNVEATNANTASTKAALKDVRGKVEVTNPTDLTGTVEAIHKLNLTTFNTNQGLPQLADNLVKLTEHVKSLRDEYDNKGTGKTAKQLSTLVEKLENVAKALTSSKVEVDKEFKKLVKDLLSEIKAIDFNPTVNVAATKVTVPEINTSGIERILTDFTTKEAVEKVDLGDYFAQDLDELEPGIQYVGFVNPKGNWYIIKNIEEENKLRYAFGSDAYADFWPRASQLQYKRLDEALNEV